MTDRIEALAALNTACWDQLAQAGRDRGHGWRRMALATAGPSTTPGEPAWPEVRTVVLREVQAEQRLLVFYTDSRAPKVAQLRAQPQASALLWCPSLGWQLRLRLHCQVDTGGLSVSSRWARLKMHPSAQDYLSPLPPGAPLAAAAAAAAVAGSAPGVASAAATPAAPSPAAGADRTHFAVVFCQVQAMDWLELHAQGHRRALFDAQGQGAWLTP